MEVKSENKYLSRAGDFVKNKYPVLLIILAIIGLLIFWALYKPTPIQVVPVQEVMQEVPVVKYYRLLDGKEVSSPDLVNPRVVAVVVENAADAWPLSGLDQAPIVYEMLAESRIPRFLTLFTPNDTFIKLGPVRSARLYFLETLKPFDALFMHVGGSPEALKKIKEYGVKDYDEFFWDDYYFRDKKRYAPHHTYISSESMIKLISDWHIEPFEYQGWKFKDALEITPSDDPEFSIRKADVIIVNYTNNTYQAKYVFSPVRKQYQRYQAKEPLLMSDNAEVWVDNVIVEEHEHQILDSLGRRKITMIGEGKAWIFRDGEKIEATWKKADVDSITRYFNSEGKEIELNRGKTWINVVEPSTFE